MSGDGVTDLRSHLQDDHDETRDHSATGDEITVERLTFIADYMAVANTQFSTLPKLPLEVRAVEPYLQPRGPEPEEEYIASNESMLNLLTPRILGHAVRMPAMLVVVSVVLGARLAGVAGALLGVPTAGVIYSLSVHYGMRIRQRREAREALARERRDAEERAEERDEFADEVERALTSRRPASEA